MNTMTNKNEPKDLLKEVASRIREMREIVGFSIEEMSEKTGFSTEQYKIYEKGADDLPFSFIHKCAIAFEIDIADLLEGQSPRLTSYQITRAGGGKATVDENGILIKNLAHKFADKIAEPYFVTYQYSEELQSKPS